MSLSVPQLVFRADKAVGLGGNVTSAEFDQNFRSLRDFANSLAALLEFALNPDGTIKDGAISTAAKLGDRIVTASKLHWWANFYGVASGTNAYTLALPPSAFLPANYGDGATTTMLVLVKFTNANTGPSTLEITTMGLAAQAIKKDVSTALAAGDIAAGDVHLLAFDGTNWQLLTTHPTGGANSAIFQVALNANQTIVAPAIDKVAFANEAAPYFDVDAAFDAVVTYLFTAPEAGYYLFEFSCFHEGIGGFELRKNSVSSLAQIWPTTVGQIVGPIYIWTAYYHQVHYLLANDTVGVWVSASGGVNMLLRKDQTLFTGYKLA